MEEKQESAVADECRPRHDGGRPKEEWVRGTCPECGDVLVSNCYYVQGKGYLIVWECWSALADEPTCAYRKVL